MSTKYKGENWFTSARNYAGLVNDLEKVLLSLFRHDLKIRAIRFRVYLSGCGEY
jgi:hypothetical protein